MDGLRRLLHGDRDGRAPRAPRSLSTIHFQLFTCHTLPCFIAMARFGDGNGLFAGWMASSAYYTATGTVAVLGCQGLSCSARGKLNCRRDGLKRFLHGGRDARAPRAPRSLSTIHYQLSVVHYSLLIKGWGCRRGGRCRRGLACWWCRRGSCCWCRSRLFGWCRWGWCGARGRSRGGCHRRCGGARCR